MKPLSLILLTLSLVGCERAQLTLTQSRIVEQQNPGCSVGSFRNGDSGPVAVVRKADSSVWLFFFATDEADKPYVEEEIITALQPKTD